MTFKEIEVAPSILSADFCNLLGDINEIDGHFRYLHIDVMDGHFVPNLSIGAPIIQSLRPVFPDLIFDTHLMITNPDFFVEVFADLGSDIITFHREVNINPTLIIQKIKKSGKLAGVSINPDTDVHTLDCILEKADLILIMSVFPGFGGQKFIPDSLKKIEYLKEMKIKNNYKYLIEIDGGVNAETAGDIIKSGCEILVAGSAIFNAEDKVTALNAIKNSANK